jgi:hypothetical protein
MKKLKTTIKDFLSESEHNDLWYHGGNSHIESFELKPTINRRGNVEGFYFTKLLDKAKSYGDIITIAKLNIKNPYILGKDKPSYEMIEEYKKELHKEDPHLPIDGNWILDKAWDFMDKGIMLFTGMSGKAQQNVYKAGGFDSVLDGNEIAVFNPSDIVIYDTIYTE